MDNVDVFRKFEQFVQDEYKRLLRLGYVLKVVEEMPPEAEASFKQLYVLEFPDDRQTIFTDPEVEYMFWAVVFYATSRRMHLQDSEATFRQYAHNVLYEHSYSKSVAQYLALAYALIVLQANYMRDHKIYPINQFALVTAYLLNGE